MKFFCILLIISTFFLTASTSFFYSDPGIEACSTLYQNCIDTAQQEFDNGVFDYNTYMTFIEHYCPAAQLNCVLDYYFD